MSRNSVQIRKSGHSYLLPSRDAPEVANYTGALEFLSKALFEPHCNASRTILWFIQNLHFAVELSYFNMRYI